MACCWTCHYPVYEEEEAGLCDGCEEIHCHSCLSEGPDGSFCEECGHGCPDCGVTINATESESDHLIPCEGCGTLRCEDEGLDLVCCATAACVGNALCKASAMAEIIRFCCVPTGRRICDMHPTTKRTCDSCGRAPCVDHLSICKGDDGVFHAICHACMAQQDAKRCPRCSNFECPACSKPHTLSACMEYKCALEDKPNSIGRCSAVAGPCKSHAALLCPCCFHPFDQIGWCIDCFNAAKKEIEKSCFQGAGVCLTSLIQEYCGAFSARSAAHVFQRSNNASDQPIRAIQMSWLEQFRNAFPSTTNTLKFLTTQSWEKYSIGVPPVDVFYMVRHNAHTHTYTHMHTHTHI